MGRNVKPSQLEGVKPVLYEVKNKTIAVKRIESLLSVLINQEFICTSQIIILSDRKLNNSILSDKSVGKYRIFESACLKRFDDGDREIRFATVQSFKGLEADVVIYLQHDVSNNIENNRIKYVGYSRARYFLYIIKVNTAE